MKAQSTLINLVRGHALLNSRMSYFIVVLLLLLGAALRIFDLANVPQGFSDDEITNIRLVDNVRQGDIYVFYPGEDGGREGIYHVLVGVVTTFVGEGTIGFRILSLWLGMLSIAIVYTLGNHLFNPIVGVVSAGLVTINMSTILLARTVLQRCSGALPGLGDHARAGAVFAGLPPHPGRHLQRRLFCGFGRIARHQLLLASLQLVHRAWCHALHHASALHPQRHVSAAAQLYRFRYFTDADYQHALPHFVDQFAAIFLRVNEFWSTTTRTSCARSRTACSASSITGIWIPRRTCQVVPMSMSLPVYS